MITTSFKRTVIHFEVYLKINKAYRLFKGKCWVEQWSEDWTAAGDWEVYDKDGYDFFGELPDWQQFIVITVASTRAEEELKSTSGIYIS